MLVLSIFEYTVMSMATCKVCGKPLKGPLSMAVGIGPVCRIQLKFRIAADRSRNLFAQAADFTWGIRSGVVCIVDPDTGASVTNDVDSVLARISADGVDLHAHPVIYRDSMGIWDEIVMDDRGGFDGFLGINERGLDAAIAKILAMQ